MLDSKVFAALAVVITLGDATTGTDTVGAKPRKHKKCGASYKYICPFHLQCQGYMGTSANVMSGYCQKAKELGEVCGRMSAGKPNENHFTFVGGCSSSLRCIQNKCVQEGMCTGTFHERGRPSAGTKCVAPCVNQSGRWGSTWCYTKEDQSQWGAECVKCPEIPDQTCEQEIVPRYMFDLPTSMLGMFRKAAVVTDAEPCAEIGLNVLKKNGTAVDAAVASMVCNGAVHSHSNGIGGGFFMTIYKKATKEVKFLNAREKAPSYATKDMFKNPKANSQRGVYSIAIPGEVKGWLAAKKEFGNPAITMKELLEPTIKMCEEGITVSRSLFGAINSQDTLKVIKKDPTLKRTFIGLVEGNTHKRKLYAETLRKIADDEDTLYAGKLAHTIIKDLKKQGSKMTVEDLKQYNVTWQEPMVANLKNGYKIYTSPPPASGGITAAILKIFDQFEFTPEQRFDENVYVKLVEAMKFAFGKRSKVGDPEGNEFKDEIEKTAKDIVSGKWAKETKEKILSMNKTKENPEFYGADMSSPAEDHGTAHISILAENGDAVSVTSTINYYFGSGIMSPSTGIIFNDQMDDFTADLNKPNIYGVAPSKYNMIRPGAIPTSSMSPTIITDSKDNVRLVIGASGGPRIISTVASTAIQHMFFNQNIKDAIDFPRLHHQLLPMNVESEIGFSKDIFKKLEDFGHTVKLIDPYYGKHYSGGRVQAVASDPESEIVTANNDRRKAGGVAGY